MCIIDNSMAKPRDNGRWLKFRFSSSGNHEGWWHRRGGAAATAEVEFAGRREVTRDHRPLCVITNRPARTVLFNRTKVQEVSSYPPPYSTCLSFFLFDPPNARRKKKRRGRMWPSEKTRSNKDVQIFERANDISRLGELRRSNLRISPHYSILILRDFYHIFIPLCFIWRKKVNLRNLLESYKNLIRKNLEI